jgi:hypothetical protein
MYEAFHMRASYAVIASVALLLSLFFLTAGMHRVLTVIPDDAAYYFKIAENVSAGRGLTFDGINRTNGFQPLWLYVLVPVFSAHHARPETMCRIVLIFQIILLAIAAILLNSTLTRFFSNRAAFLSLLLFMFFVFILAANGMESAVLVLALVALLFYGARADVFGRGGAKRGFVFGLLLGLVVLARLDMVFVPLVVLTVAFGSVRFGRGDGVAHSARAIGILAGFALIFGPYVVYNRVSFGAIMPISGALKSSFPAPTASGYALSTLGKRGWLGLLMAIVYLIWLSIARLRAPMGSGGNRGYFRGAMAVMACAILLHFLHAILFMKWAVFSWHYVPYVLFGAVMICDPADRLLSGGGALRSDVLYGLVVASIVVVGGLAAFRSLGRPPGRNWQTAAYDAALWARGNTEGDAVFAMNDAGNFGYFSERSVINLDGVVNNLELQAALREKNLRGYLMVKGVRYVVQHAFWRRPDIISGDYDSCAMSYTSHRYGSESEPIVLRRADEVYRSKRYFDGPYETVFIIWKIRYDG